MGKDPALLWYPSDWKDGTELMTFEEKGAYMTLLMAQFSVGKLSEEQIKKLLGNDFKGLWDSIKHKFAQTDDGCFYNIRLQEEKEKRVRYTESRKNNKKGKNQYCGGHMTDHTTKHMTDHMNGHMENRNRNININVDTKYSINTMYAKQISDSDEKMLNCSRGFKLNKIDSSVENIRHLLRCFVTDLDSKGDDKTDLKEFQNHFINWSKINGAKYPMPNAAPKYNGSL